MSKESNDKPPVIVVPEAVHFTPDGTLTEGVAYIPEGMSEPDACEAISEAMGGSGETRLLPEDESRDRVGRNMSFAAFGAWNSGWETDFDRKKRENAANN